MSYSVKNEKVREIGKMNITGNVVPMSWFEHLKYPSGKPHTPAIMILADIVYWYRPTELRDQRTGQVERIEQKFEADMLQKSYKEHMELFGYGRSQVKRAYDYLEDENLINREFRNINVKGTPISNVMYVEPIPERLKEITYSHINKGEVTSMQGGGATDKQTYTESSSESSSETIKGIREDVPSSYQFNADKVQNLLRNNYPDRIDLIRDNVYYYLDKYEDSQGERHPNLKLHQWENIFDNITKLEYDYKEIILSGKLYRKIVDYHFDTEYKYCDYHLPHFVSGQVIHNRYQEVDRNEANLYD